MVLLQRLRLSEGCESGFMRKSSRLRGRLNLARRRAWAGRTGRNAQHAGWLLKRVSFLTSDVISLLSSKQPQ